MSFVEAKTRYAKQAFAGIVLVNDNESWITNGRLSLQTSDFDDAFRFVRGVE